MLLYKQIKSLNPRLVKDKLKEFLKEDIPGKDHTSDSLISNTHQGSYVLRARENMIFCGKDIIENIFNKSTKTKMHTKDGQRIGLNKTIATIVGSSREILKKERVLLNLVQRMSGVASKTNEFINALNNNKIKILDTRKTTPGLRLFEKYAVQTGGGSNHRMDLSSGIMIKDNHLTTNSSEKIIQKLKNQKSNIPIQIEIDKISQITENIILIADGLLLDNMTPGQIKECIKKTKKLNNKKRKIFIEVSGGVNIKTIKKYNINGVGGISIGALTHQATSKDIGLDVE